MVIYGYIYLCLYMFACGVTVSKDSSFSNMVGTICSIVLTIPLIGYAVGWW